MILLIGLLWKPLVPYNFVRYRTYLNGIYGGDSYCGLMNWFPAPKLLSGNLRCMECSDISARIVERKCEMIAASGADAVVLGDLGCMLNIEARLSRHGDDKTRVLHAAEVLVDKAVN
jgi:hypothetical protein